MLADLRFRVSVPYTDRWTDRRTDGRTDWKAWRVTRPVGPSHNNTANYYTHPRVYIPPILRLYDSASDHENSEDSDHSFDYGQRTFCTISRRPIRISTFRSETVRCLSAQNLVKCLTSALAFDTLSVIYCFTDCRDVL